VLIYLFVFLVVSITLIFTIIKSKVLNFVTLIVSIIVILFESLRWKTGTDWNPYFELFINPEIVSINEPLYYLLNCFVAYFFNSYTIILFIISSFSIFSIINVLKTFKLNPLFGILIYLSLFIGYWGMNRQIFSIVCAFYMYMKIIEKKNLAVFFWFIMGVMFHNSFVFLFFILFFNNKHFFKFSLIFILLIVAFFNGNYIVFFLGNFSFLLDKHDLYANLEFGGNILFTILRRAPVSSLIFYFFLWLYFKKKSVDSSFIFFSFLYILGFILTILLYDVFPIFVNRFSLYFLISEIFLVPYFFNLIKAPFSKIIYILFFICFYLYVFINNINYNRELYDPYISIFDNIDRIMY
jgi:hypothetical protein